jgi:UDP-glucose 4-epimerase
VRDYVYVRDVARANLEAVEDRLPARTMNVATGVGTTTRALADLIARTAGVEARLEDGPHRAGDAERAVLDPGDAERLLGPLIPLAEGLRETVEWFRTRA